MSLIFLFIYTILGILLVGAGFNLLGDYLRYREEHEPRPSLIAIIVSFAAGAFLLYPLLSELITALIRLFESGPLP